MENQIDALVDGIRIFDDVDQCIDNLSTINEETVFLRLGCGFSHLLAILNDFKQIYYIYPSELSEYKDRWRIRRAFSDDVLFFNQVYQTFSDVHAHRMERSVSTDVQYHQSRSMRSQLLLEILLKMPPSIYSKKRFS